MNLNQTFLSLSFAALVACGPEQQTVKPPHQSDAPQETAIAKEAEITNPFLTPGTCRKVYIVTTSKTAAINELKRLTEAYGQLGGRYGVYQIKSGEYLGAQTMDRYFEDPAKYMQERRSRNITIRSLRSRMTSRIKRAAYDDRQFYQPSAYCSTGEEIVADTGMRYHEPTSTGGGGLVLSVAAWGLSTLQDAARNAGTVTTQEPVQLQTQAAPSATTPQPVEARAMSITESGTSASGKTAYKITCPSGRDFRIWRSDGEWWDAFGAQGGNSRNLNQQASFLCS